MKRNSDYVCIECGKEHGEISKSPSQTTFFTGICGVCEKEKSITHIRSFNYLQKKKTSE